MKIINNGTITLNKELTVKAWKIVCLIFDTKDYCDPEEKQIIINEFYDRYIEDTLTELCDKLKELGYILNGQINYYGGYILNGQINYYGDYDGTVNITNNVIKTYKKETLLDTSDKSLIEEIISRGYSVFKNCPSCGRFVQIEKDKILEDDLGYHVVCTECESSFDL